MKEFRKITDVKPDLKKTGAAILLVEDTKSDKFAGFKVSPSRPTDEQLKKITQFTRREFKADELYIGQMRLAHNAIDRDTERFSEEVVQRFVNSSIRKTMLLDHDRSVKDGAAGKFFDVELEKMPLQQANAETGQNLQLPDGITEVWFVSPWFYIPLEGIDPKEIVKIDAGIYDWASIGFRAESLVPIRSTEKGKEDQILYWEYRGSGDVTEMTEGSLVYLGAQPGASVKSADGKTAADPQSEIRNPQSQPGTEPPDKGLHSQTTQGGIQMTMQELLERLKIFFGRNFSESGLYDEIKVAVDEKLNLAVEGAKKPLQEEINKLKPLAEDGKAYRAGLMNEYIAQKVKLGEVSEKPENQEALKGVIANYPIDFLKSELALLKTRVYAKFPAEAQLAGGDIDRDNGKKKKNPLIPSDKTA